MSYINHTNGIKAFGLNLKRLRKVQGISQEQLAFESGVIRSQISRIERGEINTSISTVFALAKALNLHPKELLDIDFNIED